MPAYSEQVLICTGRDDWESRIEDEEDGKNLAARIKRMMGREGAYFDVSWCDIFFWSVFCGMWVGGCSRM